MKRIRNVIIAAALLTALTGCTSKETKKFQEYMDTGNYKKAASYYDKHESSIEVDNLSKLLKNSADSIMNDFNNGKFSLSEATENINALLSISPDKSKSELKSKLNLLSDIKKSQEQYDLGEKQFNAENYYDAAKCFSNVIKEDPLYEEAQNKLQLANTKYEEIKKEEERKEKEKKETARKQKADEIKKYIELGNHEEAYEALKNFKAECEDSDVLDEISEEITQAVEDEMNKKVEKYFADFKYDDACNYVKKLYNIWNFDSISHKLDSLEDDFTDFTLAEAEENAAIENYASACSIIEVAFDIVGNDNEALNKAYNEYKKHIDVYITDIAYMSCKHWIYKNENLADNTNQTYHRSLYVTNNHESSEMEYFVNKNYDKFTGIVACSSDMKNSDRSAFFEVYGDGKLIYTSPVMTRSALPEAFEIDISDVVVLKIRYNATNNYVDPSLATIYDGMLIHKNETATDSGNNVE